MVPPTTPYDDGGNNLAFDHQQCECDQHDRY
jgi:hypothetical protein